MISNIIALSILSAGPCSFSGKATLSKEGRKVEDAVIVVHVKRSDDAPIAFEAAPKTVLMHQTGFQFSPRVLVLLKGDLVQFTNDDKDEHMVATRDPPPFRFPPSRKGLTGAPQPFPITGAARIQCDIHPWMRADILVLDNPFFALAGADGTWTISDLPIGKYRIFAWEPNGGVEELAPRKCAGPTAVPTLVVEQAPARRPVRSDGTEYRKVYSPVPIKSGPN